MNYKKLFVWCLVFFWGKVLVAQWCCVDSSLAIKDETTVSLRLQISGVVNNNLADPNQGICGVRVKFEHRFVGDVTMELVSPTGQRIKLTGPIGNSGRSDFTKWFITFIPCSSNPVPDLGFKPKWDNIQSWGIFGKFYNGTYHPFQGCLEDINIGPVNGTWTLSITDDERFYEGLIESFCLLFCDQTGISCVDCSPNGGTFAIEGKSFCQGEPGLNLSDRIQFPFFTPDQNVYGYKYLIVKNDTILAITDVPDFTGWGPGKYQLCGISYLLADSLKLPVPGTLYSAYRIDLITNKLGSCAELSKNCMDIDIYPHYFGYVHKVFLCRGDSIILNGTKYENSGIYPVAYKSVNQCDSLITLDLEVVDLKINARNVDTINCARPVVNIDLRSSVVTSNASILWATSDGNIIDSSDLLNIQVNKEGNYKVVLEDGNCIDSAEFVVIKNGRIPELSVQNDTLSCKKVNVQLVASTNAMNPTFRWSDGFTDIGNDSMVQISMAGQYYVTVTDQNGCSNYTVTSVYVDTVKAMLNLSSDHITCKDSLATLTYSSTSMGSVRFWAKNGFPVGVLDTLEVKQAGNYHLHFEADNGCLSIDSIDVISDIKVPEYYVDPDTLNCWNNMEFILRDRTNSIVDSITYQGPAIFTGNTLNPRITIPGIYFVSLVDTAGCKLDTFFEVIADTSLPQFRLIADTLNCANDSVQLWVFHSNDSVGNTYTWSGPVGFQKFEKQPFVKESGKYFLNVTAPNGCTTTDSIQVIQDASKPEIATGVSGILDCLQKQVQLFGNSTAVRFDWMGPGNYRSAMQNPIVDQEGLYRLIVTGINGCTAEQSIVVAKDTMSPITNILYDTINCSKDSFLIELLSGTVLDSIAWTGSSGFKDNRQRIYVQSGGRYRLFARGQNHCVDSAEIDVPYDTSRPVFSLIGDTLNCLKRLGILNVFPVDSMTFYTWELPNGDSARGPLISISQPGLYKIKAIGKNACTTEDSIFVPEFLNTPLVNILSDSITCADSIAQIALETFDAGLTYNWSGPAQFNDTDSLIQVSLPGWYHFSVTNQNGCTTRDSVLVTEINNKYQIQYSHPVFDCVNFKNARLSAFGLDSLIQFSWRFPNGLSLSDSVINPNESGPYIFTGLDPFGCRVRDTIHVLFDTLAPIINHLFLDTLTCSRRSVIPAWSTLSQNPKIRWVGPKSDTSYLAMPVFTESGFYHFHIVDSNFCFSDTSVFLAIDTVKPVLLAIGDTITCEFSRAQLKLVTQDSLTSVIWTGPDKNIYAERSPQVIDTGWYRVEVIGLNGCLAIDSGYVDLDNNPPDLKVMDAFIPCNLDSIQIFAQSSDSTVIFNWFGPQNYFSNSKNPFIRDTGFYEIIVISKNKCASKDTIHVSYKRDVPDVFVKGGHINCLQKSVELEAQSDTSFLKFKWVGPGLVDSMNLTLNINQPGNYIFSATNKYGCVKDTMITVLIDTVSPITRIIMVDSIVCDKRSAKLVSAGPLLNDQLYWGSTSGMISGPNNTDTVMVTEAATYYLIRTNPVNGCKDSVGIVVAEIIPDLRPRKIQLTDPSCFGFHDGSLMIESVSGGLEPYLFQLNHSGFSKDTIFDNLPAGIYMLRLQGRFGCKWDTLVELTEPPPVWLNVGNDTTIRIGAMLNIVPSTNANVNWLTKIEWMPPTFLDCDQCFEVTSVPQNSIVYKLDITDENGCPAEDEIRINVIIEPDIYVPNVFSPNGDQINDYVTLVTGQEVSFIRSFRIFDRWGNGVFEVRDVDPKQKEVKWDGSFKGMKMNPGVFVFAIEAILVNGSVFKKQGDITLLR